jgi:glycosyltransferase involved in cell wall biosynthesis
LARCADAILVLSSEEQRLWQRYLPHGTYFLVRNPYRPHMSGHSRKAHDRPTILFVGRIMRAKGVFDLLEAFAKLREVHACRLSLVGQGPDRGPAQEWVTRRGLAGDVDLHGYLDGAEPTERYPEADVLVLPTYWSEGFPTVLAGAMDAGLPIVTTRLRGMADHLQEGVNCLFVAPRDHDGIFVSLRTLLDDPHLRESMGEANRSKLADFSPDVVVGDYLRVLDFVSEGQW